MISKTAIYQHQASWAKGIIYLGSLVQNQEKLQKEAKLFIRQHYAFETGTLLFKPTQATEKPFRTNKAGVLSYFIGGNHEFPEDMGFVLKPWVDVQFKNAGIIIGSDTALAMGHYIFIDPKGEQTIAEYSFGYIPANDQTLKLNLHHSSIPFAR